jgi:hypothetical protein
VDGYLFPTFKGDTVPEEKIWFLYSGDGINWMEVGCQYSPSASIILRDPSILVRNGKYWMAITTGGDTFKVVNSTDGIFWSDVATPSCTGAGAPEWFIDDDDTVHIFCQSTADGGVTYSIYHLTPTDDTMVAWNPAVQVTGTGLPTWAIDPFMVKIGATYYLFVRTSGITVWSSSTIDSGYTVYKTADWAGWGLWEEGVSIVQLANGKWRMYTDSASAITPPHGLYYSDSATTDPFGAWGAVTLCTTPYTCRHGTVIRR